MLPFCFTLLILVFSSSVVAMPWRPSHQDDGESKVLIRNTDIRLQKTRWGRVKLSKTENTTGWTSDAQYLDDVIQFGTGTSKGVEDITLSRVMRELLPNTQRPGPEGEIRHNEYRVVRKNRAKDRPAERLTLLGPVPIDEKCRPHLDDTHWGRIPEILGPVRCSLMVWKCRS